MSNSMSNGGRLHSSPVPLYLSQMPTPVGLTVDGARRGNTIDRLQGRPAVSSTARHSSARSVLVSQLFVLIFLQKFMIMDVSVVLGYFLLSVGWLVAVGKAAIVPRNAVLYGVMLCFAVASQLSAGAISISSLFLFFALTIVYVIAIPLETVDYNHLIKKYCTFMLLPGILVLAQYVYQSLNGPGHSLGLEPYVPSRFLLPGYMAESSTAFWITWNRPNGVVFLEPSYCSAFLAIALIIDFQVFRRYARAAFFFVALIATNGGTGWLVLLISSLSLGLSRYPLRTIIAVAIAAIAGLLAQQFMSDLPLISRMNEFSNSDSSGYARILLPFKTVFDLLADHHRLFGGDGAGQITADYGSSWPIVKTTFEYGICTAVAYFLLFVSALMAGHKVPVRMALFIVFQFTGGYLLNPFLTNLIFVLCASYHPARPAGERVMQGRAAGGPVSWS